MPRKRKASAARAEGLRVSREAFSAKRSKSTPEHSGDSESEVDEKTSESEDEIVHLIIMEFSESTT